MLTNVYSEYINYTYAPYIYCIISINLGFSLPASSALAKRLSTGMTLHLSQASVTFVTSAFSPNMPQICIIKNV
jgi:hypothetical protein